MALDPSMTWQRGAVCGPDVAAGMTSDAKPSDEFLTGVGLMCAACPVVVDCARYALRNNESGYWAGVWIYQKGQHRSRAFEALKRKAALR